MKTIKYIFLTILLLNSGCATYMVAKNSQEQMNTERRAVHIQGNDQDVFVGVDLFSLDVLTKQPGKQIGAALLDGVVAYYAYSELKPSSGGSGNDGNITIDGGQQNVFNINAHNINRTDTRTSSNTQDSGNQ